MRKEGRIQNFVIALFGVALVAMSIGFATYATTLTIGSTAGGASATQGVFKKAKWSVHYDHDSATTTANSTVTPTSLAVDNNDTNVYFTATFNKPGDILEFTVDIVNDGTYNALLNSVTMSTLTAQQDAYIDYVITYDGNTFTADDTAAKTITTTSTLNAPVSPATETTKTATVRVTYVKPDSESALPSSGDVTVNFSASFNFVETT